MLFSIEDDNGTSIVAYVVPDTGGTTPSVRLSSNGIELLTMEANDQRQNLVEAGRHSTGQCGFVIDETRVPGLAGYVDLEITETSSNVLIYRRRPPRAVDAQIFRMETHLLPLWRLDEAFRQKFHYWYYGVDRFGLETSTQVFCIDAPSRYISGRLQFRTFEYYLTQGVRVVGIIRDPFHELAERLVLLKNIGGRADEILGVRDAMTYGPIIIALQDYNLNDEASYKRFFKKTPVDILKVLSNPLVRQLSGSTPDEMPGRTSLALSLDALASFEIIGLRSNAEAFSQTFADLTGLDLGDVPRISEYPKIAEFGERLREFHAMEELLEKDLEVFELTTQAIKAAEA